MHLLQIPQISSHVPPDKYDNKTQNFGSFADDSFILLESIEKHAKYMKLVFKS